MEKSLKERVKEGSYTSVIPNKNKPEE